VSPARSTGLKPAGRWLKGRLILYGHASGSSVEHLSRMVTMPGHDISGSTDQGSERDQRDRRAADSRPDDTSRITRCVSDPCPKRPTACGNQACIAKLTNGSSQFG
jgi:hypothetical protein